MNGQTDDAARIGADATLLQALVRLIETGGGALAVEEDGRMRGQVTLSSIYGGLQAGRRAGEPSASHPSADEPSEVDASAQAR